MLGALLLIGQQLLPQRLILLRDQFRLLETAARAIGDHSLAVRLSTQAGIPGLGAYGAHLITLPTLGDALLESSRSLASLLQGATRIDLQALAVMSREIFPSAWTETALHIELQREEGRIWLARSEDVENAALAGFIVVRRVGDALHVEALGVSGPLRRRGVGLL